MALPLEGIRVIELGGAFAGPFAAGILARMGADVIKVERPEGDDARGWGPPFWNGVSPAYLAMNSDKRGITLDLKDPKDVAWLMDEVTRADVLVHNMRPGVMEELGLGSDVMLAKNPRLIYASIWALGRTGPLKLNPGFEPMVQAFSGLMAMNGDEDSPPTRVGTSLLDFGTGMWAAMGALAGIIQRGRTGKGCVVDASLLETALGWLTGHYASYRISGEVPVRHRTGSSRLIPFEGFETKNGEIIIAAGNDRLFAKLAAALGHPEWATDPRYAKNTGRSANKEDCWARSARSSPPAPRASGWTSSRRPACPARPSTPCPRSWSIRRPRPSGCCSRCRARTTSSWWRCRSTSTARSRASAARRPGSASTTRRFAARGRRGHDGEPDGGKDHPGPVLRGRAAFVPGTAPVPAAARARPFSACGAWASAEPISTSSRGISTRAWAKGRIIGHETFAEVVEAPAGAPVRAGDRVVINPVVSCGECRACKMGAAYVCYNLKVRGVDVDGGMRELYPVPVDRLLKVPDTLSDDHAALIEPLAVATHDVNRAQVKPGDAVLVFGGGPIGALIAMVCRHRGARVAVAEINPFRVDMLKGLGLEVVGPDRDVMTFVKDWTQGEGVDVSFEVTGNPKAVRLMTDVVRVWGTISIVAIHSEPMPVNLLAMFSRELNMHASRLYTWEAWEEAIRLAAAGAVTLGPLVSRKIPLEALGEGMEQALKGGPVMKVLVDLTL